MAIQIVDTEAIAATAMVISAANTNMDNAFEAVRRLGGQLDDSWNSAAGSVATSALYQLFRGQEARSACLLNHANILQQVVAPGFEQCEQTNVLLADQFL